jgi:hypothetical protein
MHGSVLSCIYVHQLGSVEGFTNYINSVANLGYYLIGVKY